jgi:hypothetical protein
MACQRPLHHKQFLQMFSYLLKVKFRYINRCYLEINLLFEIYVLGGVIFCMTLRVVPSNRDVRTRSAASRNVDFETRYVIVCVVARVADEVEEER